MRLWLLKPLEPWDSWYDKVFGFVVRAESADAARAFAEDKAGEESRDVKVWLSPELTSCEELTADGDVGVILRDFASA